MPENRDVYNPLLFEIAWEVANKGKSGLNTYRYYACHLYSASGRYLHCDQDKSTCYSSRIWR